jgi:hypothetical protein
LQGGGRRFDPGTLHTKKARKRGPFVFHGGAFMQLGLVALTGVIAFNGRGGYRLLALVPAGTIAAIILFVVAGGPIMLASWLTAGMLALALPTSTTARAARGMS